MPSLKLFTIFSVKIDDNSGAGFKLGQNFESKFNVFGSTTLVKSTGIMC